MKMNLDFSAYECRGITSQSPEAETLRRMNPTDNELTVKYNLLKQECAIIEIFDILGREVVGTEHEAALMQLADDLFENSVASDETWATLSKTYSTEQLMDAVFTVGQYNLVSWALNSFGVPLDDFLPGAQKK